jgi:hypothetical protein
VSSWWHLICTSGSPAGTGCASCTISQGGNLDASIGSALVWDKTPFTLVISTRSDICQRLPHIYRADINQGVCCESGHPNDPRRSVLQLPRLEGRGALYCRIYNSAATLYTYRDRVIEWDRRLVLGPTRPRDNTADRGCHGCTKVMTDQSLSPEVRQAHGRDDFQPGLCFLEMRGSTYAASTSRAFGNY